MNNIKFIHHLRGIVRLLIPIWKVMPIRMTLWLLIPTTMGFLIVPVFIAQKQLIDIMVTDLTIKPWKDILTSALPSLILFTSVMLIQEIMEVFRRWMSYSLTEKATIYVQEQIIDMSSSVSYASFDSPVFHDRLQRAQAFIGKDLVGMFNDTIQVVKVVSNLIGLLTVILSSGYWSATVIVLVMIIVNLFIKLRTEIKVRRLNREMTHDGRMADYLRGLLTEPIAIRDMRLNDSLSFISGIWGDISRTQHSRRYGARRNEIKIGGVTGLIQTTAILLVLMLMVGELVEGLITVGMITVMFMSMTRVGSQVITLTWPLSRLYVQGTKAIDLVEFLHHKDDFLSDIADKAAAFDAPALLNIMFENVSFRYPQSNEMVLKKITFDIRKGEKIAIVGENGSGKSTLVRLLMNLYNPIEGNLLWNGIDIKKWEINNRITAVFQDFLRYQLTLRENVSIGDFNKLKDDSHIIKVLRDCGLGSLYEELGTLDAPLGRLIENGRELSGGQWQRLALARAIISDADLIILDEPTSALDPSAEVEMFKQFQEICKNATSIFISHRLGWARYADRILVLEKGELVEIGTHDELMQVNGVYANSYRTQASWYKKETTIK
ncbi:ABC transporter ATP-binding protein [Paenibacillus polymyxa]|uniref:ABC transporter ATP-binding protein n=1 Tax=Paenibacillus polymyxa TaxID=1406 RepID=UPI001BEADE6A|nr:ABC transporter ATP-binding protein [Paenibacillus polymyxa]MBT2282960.1 ABC transporter ATP-binding protein [Paenibacillus polymyxa]